MSKGNCVVSLIDFYNFSLSDTKKMNQGKDQEKYKQKIISLEELKT